MPSVITISTRRDATGAVASSLTPIATASLRAVPDWWSDERLASAVASAPVSAVSGWTTLAVWPKATIATWSPCLTLARNAPAAARASLIGPPFIEPDVSIASTIDEAADGAATVSWPTSRRFSVTTKPGAMPGVDVSAATVIRTSGRRVVSRPRTVMAALAAGAAITSDAVARTSRRRIRKPASGMPDSAGCGPSPAGRTGPGA